MFEQTVESGQLETMISANVALRAWWKFEILFRKLTFLLNKCSPRDDGSKFFLQTLLQGLTG